MKKQIKIISELEESLVEHHYLLQNNYLQYGSFLKLQGLYQYSFSLENLPFYCHKEEIDNRKIEKIKAKRKNPGTIPDSHV